MKCFQRDYGGVAASGTDHVYRLPKYVSSGLGGSSANFSLAECKDEEDASRKKEVDDLISKYAPKNVEKQLEQVSQCACQCHFAENYGMMCCFYGESSSFPALILIARASLSEPTILSRLQTRWRFSLRPRPLCRGGRVSPRCTISTRLLTIRYHRPRLPPRPCPRRLRRCSSLPAVPPTLSTCSPHTRLLRRQTGTSPTPSRRPTSTITSAVA